MKDKVLNKLIRVSKKRKWLRYPMLGVIFVFLGVCHFGRYLVNLLPRIIGVAFVAVIFLLSSSFALPVLLDIDMESKPEVVFESDLEGLLQTGELNEVLLEDDVITDDGLDGYETYDVNEVETYSIDEILMEHEEYLTSMEAEEAQETFGQDEESMIFTADDWRLVLINKQHPIPEDYDFTLMTITGNMQCDERIMEDLLLMLQAAKNDNVNLIICSPYRTDASQVTIFERHVRAYMNKGLNYMDSFKLASQEATVPGYSEHQVGLSLDIYTASHMILDDAYGETEAGRWLAENCSDYGFILRYPKGKESITSIGYEPWHFRYVGREAAKIIMNEGITLEEFWEHYVNGQKQE
ncbi:MAG: D-alanyl-D-alanine carboxypeptidase family protein [bacterium]|nr:D-alanyl-D-alanine carboxypeptidase family protein [bacterium]